MRCPLCLARKAAAIVYGAPTEEQLRDANQRKVFFGGRRKTGDDPTWHCQKCGYEWRSGSELA